MAEFEWAAILDINEDLEELRQKTAMASSVPAPAHAPAHAPAASHAAGTGVTLTSCPDKAKDKGCPFKNKDKGPNNHLNHAHEDHGDSCECSKCKALRGNWHNWKNIQCGDRVQRGPDWKYGAQDGPPPAMGTVTEKEKDRQFVWVRWDKRPEAPFCYRMGAENQWEVQKAQDVGAASSFSSFYRFMPSWYN